ncbi:hypothetical protein F4X88_21620 [Candidatus Poribacteria bacterium]|nr:hypothetical protein [Candidatus Poribacteria bacterium]MYA58884.1 hypothetical protein [Candidatus Poribacteria bacterium]
MKGSRFLTISFYILLTGFVLSFASCGGSNLNNPVSEGDAVAEGSGSTDGVVELTGNLNAEETTEQIANLDVKVTVTKKTVDPGEEVELAASVKGVRGSSVTLNWLNITKYGKLSASSENPITWTAPQTLNGANAQVEVIQLIVTVISEVVSVGASGIDTDTQIISETKTVLLTVRD